MKRPGIYNRIWIPAACLLIFLLGFISMKSLIVQSLALEQQARCGIEEHTHEQDCYRNSRLICGKPEHSHTENCYLVLLKDNDINVLLNHVERQMDKSLESLIGQTVDNALLYNHNLTSPMAMGQETVNVAAINETIVENDIQPQVMLNEDLYKTTSASDGQLPTADRQMLLQQEEEGGGLGTQLLYPEQIVTEQGGSLVSPLALDDPTSGSNYMANYYVYLDGSWRSLGNMEFSVQYSSWRYTARETTSDIVTLYNHSLGTSLTADDLNLIYATSANAASYSWTEATTSGNYTYYGTNYSRQNTARAAKYIRLVDARGDPLAFYTVTFEYPDNTVETRIVRSGETITLPDRYAWQMNGTEYAGGSNVQIYSASTFTARQTDGNSTLSIM